MGKYCNECEVLKNSQPTWFCNHQKYPINVAIELSSGLRCMPRRLCKTCASGCAWRSRPTSRVQRNHNSNGVQLSPTAFEYPIEGAQNEAIKKYTDATNSSSSLHVATKPYVRVQDVLIQVRLSRALDPTSQLGSAPHVRPAFFWRGLTT